MHFSFEIEIVVKSLSVYKYVTLNKVAGSGWKTLEKNEHLNKHFSNISVLVYNLSILKIRCIDYLLNETPFSGC